PSGLEETFTDLHADQTITVVEGSCISPNVSIAGSPALVLCPDSDPITLTAAPGPDLAWSTGGQGASISVADPGSYWVLAGTGDCTTQAVANILLSPDETPTVTVAGETTICPLDQVVLTASPASSYAWSNGSDQQSIAVSTAGAYTVTVQGACEPFSSAPVVVSVLDAPAAPTSEDVTIPVAGTAVLTATGDSIQWYAQETGGLPVGQGSPWTTPFVDTNTLFWCADLGQNGGDSEYGGRVDRSTEGVFQNNGTYYLLFNTTADLVIKSVKVYANGAGERPIALVDQGTGQTLASGDFFIPDGESRVQLDLFAPANGNYALRIVSGNPQLWRDGVGSNPAFPYDLGGLGAITGSNAGSAAYYYFFYDWEVAAPTIWCEGPRTPVEVLVGPTGLSADQQLSGLRVFPNPAKELIILDGELPAGATSVEIIHAAGRTCLRQALSAADCAVPEAALAPGAYAVQVRGHHAVSRTPFVKQ